MGRAKGYVVRMIMRLMAVIIKMAWAGRFLIACILLAPTYCETMDEIALRVWPRTQISMDIKVPTMPTAANDSVALISIFPIMAVSVMDKIGSEIPDIRAGIASLLMCLNCMDSINYLGLNETLIMFKRF